MTHQINVLKETDLYFDIENPRMVEFDITYATPEQKILNLLWRYMAVDEIVMSILAHGFFDHEAVYAVKENGRMVVVEGNRRLAAVKAILHPELIENSGMNRFLSKITEEKRQKLEEGIPVIELSGREEAWRYIGFKHVNGAAKWGSYAKAKYIASVHENFGMPLAEIAEQIGDTNNTVKKLYQGLMVIREAENRVGFRAEDTYRGRIFFSHLYTSIGYEGFRDYMGLTLNTDGSIEIPIENNGKLGEVMTWLYGSKSNNITPVIKSQNPDLKHLDAVLKNRESVEVLRSTSSLDTAYEISLGGSSVLYTSLVDAKIALQKALANSTYYKGEEDVLRTAGTIADTADALYSGMEKIYQRDNPSKTNRISE